MTSSFDVVVVGAGPGGVAAATVAAEAGSRVCLLDDNPAPGGQIWRGFSAQSAPHLLHGRSYCHWMSRFWATGCELLTGARVVSAPAHRILRVEGKGEVRDLAFKDLIVATGARERFLPFPGWTLPGVVGAAALQAFSKAGFDPAGKRVVVAGSGPLLLAVAAGLSGKGAAVAGIYEQAPLRRLAGLGLSMLFQPGKLWEGAIYRWQTRSVPYRTGCWVVGAEGKERLERVTITDGRRQWTRECEMLACGFHLVPNLELPRLLGCQIANGYVRVDPCQRTSVAHVACVGELTGIGGLEKALLEGQIAGSLAAGNLSRALQLQERLQKQLRFARRLDRAFQLRSELRALAAADTLVCRCEDVSYEKLRETGSWRAAKLQTRCGMGACQGRVCGAASEFLFGWKPDGVRPPIYPSTVETMAAEMSEIEE